MADKEKYTLKHDYRTKKYGVIDNETKAWWIEPKYDAIARGLLNDVDSHAWIKNDGKFGYLDVANRKEIIPCEYGFPLYFTHGYAEAWKDYKTGIINLKNEVVIPIIYDELHARYERVDVPEEERRIVKMEDGTEQRVGPKYRDVFHGYACFTNDGGQQAYDENMQPCDFSEREQDRLNCKYEWNVPEDADRTVGEIEQCIRIEYEKWCKMGGGMPYSQAYKYDNNEADDQKVKVMDLIYDRCHKMNESWVHDKEHADRISRTNELLKRAVRKALKLGRKTAKSLEWMKKVTNQDGYGYEVSVYVYPQWTNSKSELGYKPTLSRSKEEDKLIDEEDNCHNHIWNIIAAMNDCYKIDGVGACFEHSSENASAKEWNVSEAEMDDGQSWDECIHYPAYMDCYFLHSFHALYCDLFQYSMEDIAQMNDFRVRVDVKLETKEKD